MLYGGLISRIGAVEPVYLGLSCCFHVSAWSSGEPDDWDRNQGRLAPTHGGTKNVPYLPDEEEEEDAAAEGEQGQERGKVTVRRLSRAGEPGFHWMGWALRPPAGQNVPTLPKCHHLNWAAYRTPRPKTGCYEPELLVSVSATVKRGDESLVGGELAKLGVIPLGPLVFVGDGYRYRYRYRSSSGSPLSRCSWHSCREQPVRRDRKS